MSSSVKNSSRKRSGWKQFITPGWIISTVLIITFSYFAFTLLAPWQLGKDDAIVQRNEQIKHAYELDPVPVESLLTQDGFSPNDRWRRVTLTGHYLADDEVLLRLRPVDKHPAFHSLVPFQLDSGLTILVNRGYTPAVNGDEVGEFAPAPRDKVTITGMVQSEEPAGDRAPIREQGYDQIYMISPETVTEITGVKLAHDYVQLDKDQPGVLEPIPIPVLDRGSHLSYGLQWIAFGVMAPAALIYFVVNEIKERRRFAEEEKVMAATDSAPAGGNGEDDNDDIPVSTTPQRSRNVRDRYGKDDPSRNANYAKRRRERY